MTPLQLKVDIVSLNSKRDALVPKDIEMIFENPDIIALTHSLHIDSRGYYKWGGGSIIIKDGETQKYLNDYKDITPLGDDVMRGFLALLMHQCSISGDFLMRQWDDNNGGSDDNTYLDFVIMRDFFGLMMEDWVNYGDEFMGSIETIFDEDLEGEEREEEIENAYDDCYFNPLGLFFVPKTESAHGDMQVLTKLPQGLDAWKNIIFFNSDHQNRISLQAKDKA